MLAPDVVWTSDSDGKVSAARRPVLGRRRRWPGCIDRPDPSRAGAEYRVEPAIYNSAPAMMRLPRRRSWRASSPIEVIDGKITNFYAMRNPEKLATVGHRSPQRRDQPLTPIVRLASARGGQARAMRIERLGDLGSCRRGAARGRRRRRRGCGLPPPAALIGDWFGSRAVIAPSVAIAPTDPAEVFAVAPGRGGDAVGGGWIGYLSYPDAAADGRGPRIPEAAGGWTDCVLRLRPRRVLVVRKPLRRNDARPWVVAAAGLAGTAPSRATSTGTTPISPHTSAACWTAWTAIGAGRGATRPACARSSPERSRGSPVDFFADAVTRTAPARAAYLAGDWGAVASLSPELFLRRRGDPVTSSPIKGTLPLHADPAALRASVKDVAENIMIVDLVRNDLGRVADDRIGDRARTAGGARRAGRVASGVDGVSATVPDDLPTRGRAGGDVPAGVGHRNAENPCPPTAFAVGAAPARGVLRHSRLGVTGRGLRAERGDPHRGVRRRRRRGARRRRRHHRRLRPGRRVGGVPAQGGAAIVGSAASPTAGRCAPARRRARSTAS